MHKRRCQRPPGLLCGTSCIQARGKQGWIPGINGITELHILTLTHLPVLPPRSSDALAHSMRKELQRPPSLAPGRGCIRPEGELCSPLPGDVQSQGCTPDTGAKPPPPPTGALPLLEAGSLPPPPALRHPPRQGGQRRRKNHPAAHLFCSFELISVPGDYQFKQCFFLF